MSWNYRVMTLNRGESYGIHEVYYDDKGCPNAYTENDMKPFGENIDELRNDLKWMLAALDKPILTPQEFPETENNNEGK